MNEIYIDDVIGESIFEYGITDRYVKNLLDSMSGDVVVHIKSPGGSLFEGNDIVNTIKDYDRGDVQVVIGSLAGSIASVIAFAGTGLPMVRNNSSIFIHDPSTIVMGTAEEMRQTAITLDKTKESIVTTYRDAVEDKNIDFSALMSAETWFTAQEAIDLGLAIPYEKITPTNKTEFHGMNYQDLMKSFQNKKHTREDGLMLSDEESNLLIQALKNSSLKDLIEGRKQQEELEPDDYKYPNPEARKRYLEILADAS